MSKSKAKRHKGAVQAKTNHQANAKAKGPDEKEEKGGKKKRTFFKRVEKKQKEQNSAFLPPKDAQAFSANWKKLVDVSLKPFYQIVTATVYRLVSVQLQQRFS